MEKQRQWCKNMRKKCAKLKILTRITEYKLPDTNHQSPKEKNKQEIRTCAQVDTINKARKKKKEANAALQKVTEMEKIRLHQVFP